jgi:hypothetical protein
MSFWKAVRDIDKSLEETFEKNADKAVNDPDDGKQAWQDAQKAGEDAENTASDAASDEIKNHDPAWKAVKDLSDKAIAAESKAVETTKLGWLKFVGVVTAIFPGAIFFASTHAGPSAETKAALETIRRSEVEVEQVNQLSNIVLSMDDWNIMMGGIEVQSVPTPTEAPAPLPLVIAAAAAEPLKVEVTTPAGTREFTTTVEKVYRESPSRVQQQMIQQPPPPKIDHDYDHPDPNDCFVRHCLGGDLSKAGGFHTNINVTAVDGNGNSFGSAHIHN